MNKLTLSLYFILFYAGYAHSLEFDDYIRVHKKGYKSLAEYNKRYNINASKKIIIVKFHKSNSNIDFN